MIATSEYIVVSVTSNNLLILCNFLFGHPFSKHPSVTNPRPGTTPSFFYRKFLKVLYKVVWISDVWIGDHVLVTHQFCHSQDPQIHSQDPKNFRMNYVLSRTVIFPWTVPLYSAGQMTIKTKGNCRSRWQLHMDLLFKVKIPIQVTQALRLT